MSFDEVTLKCPICGKPYVGYGFYIGDQSACHKCRAEARKQEYKGLSDGEDKQVGIVD